ncbi:MAG: tetratricopeptide repeat protein, partial [Methanoregula sp.]|nr:tetratricopeptide repeat protein [Methanoregula sp.]
RYDEALRAYDKALKQEPENEVILGGRQNTINKMKESPAAPEKNGSTKKPASSKKAAPARKTGTKKGKPASDEKSPK